MKKKTTTSTFGNNYLNLRWQSCLTAFSIIKKIKQSFGQDRLPQRYFSIFCGKNTRLSPARSPFFSEMSDHLNIKKFHCLNVSFIISMILIFVMIFVGCNTKSDLEPKLSSENKSGYVESEIPSDNLLIWKILDTTSLMANFVLDLEKMHQFETTEEHLNFVDDLLHTWEPPIKTKPQYSKEEAIQTLTSIHKFLKKQDYKLKDYHPTLNMSISYKYFDCDVLSVFYKTLAEQYQLPIECVYSPKHLSILWKDAENEIYWETTSGEEVNRKHYLSKYKLNDKEAEESGILRSLNRKEIAAIVLHNLARAKFAKKEYDKSLRIVYQSLKMFPELPENHLLLGRIFAGKEDYNNAELSYKMYLDEIPHKKAEKELTDMFVKIGCLEPYVCCQGKGNDDPTDSIMPR